MHETGYAMPMEGRTHADPRNIGGSDRTDRPLTHQLGILRDRVNVQRKLLEELGGRLSPLIANVPRPDARNGADKPVQPALSSIADEIRAAHAAIQECNDVVQALLANLEV
jgi:hypothetical protein